MVTFLCPVIMTATVKLTLLFSGRQIQPGTSRVRATVKTYLSHSEQSVIDLLLPTMMATENPMSRSFVRRTAPGGYCDLPITKQWHLYLAREPTRPFRVITPVTARRTRRSGGL